MGRQYINKIGAGLTAFAFAFFVTLFVSSQFTPVTDSSAAEVISAQIDAASYYANITSAGTLDLDVTATPTGAKVASKDTLTVDTNAANGYKVYLSTVSNAVGQ
ncbi:hypothetical protein IJH74_01225, partial [Candidatus Saccharibacteria bacterium]|nr:hypothetical protein [Candidatus Saccharibacteria bacterium]